MLTTIPLLQNVKVASPCSASWEGMDQVDGDRVHFCSGCKKNVYNLSAMSQAEAEGLLRKHEGHLCVRYYQRKDGTILTQNCPIGLQAIRLELARSSMVAATLLAAIVFSKVSAGIVSNSQGSGATMGVPMSPAPSEQVKVYHSASPKKTEPVEYLGMVGDRTPPKVAKIHAIGDYLRKEAKDQHRVSTKKKHP